MIGKYILLIFFLVFIITPAFAYNSGFRPVYQPTLPPSGIVSIHDIGNVTSIGCALGQVLAVNGSAIWACLTLSPGSSGNATVLDDLGDVTITSPNIFSILYYNGLQWIDQIFKINNQTSSKDIFITGINNQTGVITTNQFSINNSTCTGNTFLKQLNNITGFTVCATPSSSASSLKIDNQTETKGNFITAINNATGDITRQIFKVNNQTSAKDVFITGIKNTTGIITTNQFSVNNQTTNGGDRFLTGINNASGYVTTKIFSVNLKTCSGTDKVSSIDNSTGNVICSSDSTGSGSGVPMPPKKWGHLMPKSTAGGTTGLVASCTILATASFVYDTTDNSNAILSTTAVTDGINGGIHCSGTNMNSFRGDQNAYMYSKVEWNKITTNRVFVGFVNSATHLPNNADTILDNLSGYGICIRTTDTLIQECRNDGDATTDYASTGLTETAGTVYAIEVYAISSGTSWCYKINGSAETCKTTEIPATTTQMYADSTGETDGGGSAILWTQYYWYLQSDK